MPQHACRVVCLVLPVILLHAPAAAGQETPGPTHAHYERSELADRPGPGGELAPRRQKLGTHTFPVTTSHAQAQRFIDQGVNLTYGFNHAEARRAFRENGWALFGLAQALRAQGKQGQAELVEARFRQAWARTDVQLPASRFGRPLAPAAR